MIKRVLTNALLIVDFWEKKAALFLQNGFFIGVWWQICQLVSC